MVFASVFPLQSRFGLPTATDPQCFARLLVQSPVLRIPHWVHAILRYSKMMICLHSSTLLLVTAAPRPLSPHKLVAQMLSADALVPLGTVQHCTRYLIDVWALRLDPRLIGWVILKFRCLAMGGGMVPWFIFLRWKSIEAQYRLIDDQIKIRFRT